MQFQCFKEHHLARLPSGLAAESETARSVAGPRQHHPVLTRRHVHVATRPASNVDMSVHHCGPSRRHPSPCDTDSYVFTYDTVTATLHRHSPVANATHVRAGPPGRARAGGRTPSTAATRSLAPSALGPDAQPAAEQGAWVIWRVSVSSHKSMKGSARGHSNSSGGWPRWWYRVASCSRCGGVGVVRLQQWRDSPAQWPRLPAPICCRSRAWELDLYQPSADSQTWERPPARTAHDGVQCDATQSSEPATWGGRMPEPFFRMPH